MYYSVASSNVYAKCRLDWLRIIELSELYYVSVIFIDKSLLQIRAKIVLLVRAFTDKGLITFADKVFLQIRASVEHASQKQLEYT